MHRRFFTFIFLQLFLIVSLYSQTSYKQGFKFARFIDYLDSYYVDSIDADKLVEEAIERVLQDLDPHSTYIPADELKRMREPLQGNFEGIGISFNILNDTLYVISPIAGGPSETVGVLSGDKIIKVDGDNIAGIGLTNEDVFSLLRGDKGTKVTISVLRRNVNELLDFEIIRDKIPIFSIDASYMLSENTGYIKINRFSATTMEEFHTAANSLIQQNALNLVIDLTNNGGGYLDAAVKLSDEFLTEGSLIVYTEGLHSPKNEYLATQNGSFLKDNVIVLIDEGSASASEIFAGAIQDWDRGIIIGRRTFGKGLVQREMMLPDESAVRITTAKYYTPSGRLIQKPYDQGLDKYQLEVFERYSNGQLQSEDSINFPDSLKYKTLLKRRTVYGGGGIMPDIFIPFDTSYYSDFYRDILRKGVLNQFVLEYIDNNRAKLQRNYPDFNSFQTQFRVNSELFSELIEFSNAEDVKCKEEDLEVSKTQIEVMLKALMARSLYGNSEFYQVFNTTNNIYQKAIEVIEDWDKYQSELQ
ncbi:MAG: S41 family peptidase [Bacteroidales bacterium]|nr:S41 family peptidase [Bacteroidales bacterium]MBN2818339.1 S41 family peptidase [Bacteroidales bacterium]